MGLRENQKGNEEDDILAKEGTNVFLSGMEPFWGLSQKAKRLIRLSTKKANGLEKNGPN